LATAHEPKALILDEPTSGLDPIVRRHFLESMVDHAAQERTVLLSSHQINEVERVADWVGFLHQGELKLVKPLQELRDMVSIVTIAEWQMRKSDDFQFPWQKAVKRSKAELKTRRRSDGTKPSASRSLLWQQFRQIKPYAIAWTVGIFLSVGGLRLAFGESPAFNYLLGQFVQAVVFLGACSLGALAFYGDGQNGRKTFLADRGVAAFQVWWTRLLPAYIAYVPFQLLQYCLLTRTSVFTGIDESTVFNRSAALAATLVIFVCAAFVSQWFKRPILAFIAAPSFALGVIGVTFLTFRHGSWATLILSAVVLLFASWRMTRRWMEGRGGFRFAGSVIGYTALAIIIPWLLASFWAAIT
jgi:hypothetical protein